MTTKPQTKIRSEPAPAVLIRRLVELAGLAPSVHNTQPWRWRYDGAFLTLLADEDRRLVDSDPNGRNLTISCGAALHHLQFAARALGCDTVVALRPDDAVDGELAQVRIHLGPGRPVLSEDIDLIRTRCTDRRRFTAWPVPDDRLLQLCRVAEAWGVKAAAILGDRDRIRLEVLANRALTFMDLDAHRRVEQDSWIEHGPVDGIPLDHLPDAPNPLQARTRFRPGVLEDTRLVVHGGDRVIAIGTSVDDRSSWLHTGRALSAVWLEATRGGVSVVPMSQPIEVDSIRTEITKTVLGNSFRPHILLQVGLQALGRGELPRTPRRPVEDVLEVRPR